MIKQMKHAWLTGFIVLLFAACVPANATSTPAPTVPPAAPVQGLAPEKYRPYVGMIYPPLPAGLTEEFGMLIQDANDHSLSLVSDGTNKMLWFSQLTHYDANGNAFWQVKDILGISDLEPGLTLIPDGCSLNGVPDSELFVVGKGETIQLAWRANTALNVFEVIPINGIQCHSDKAVPLE